MISVQIVEKLKLSSTIFAMKYSNKRKGVQTEISAGIPDQYRRVNVAGKTKRV